MGVTPYIGTFYGRVLRFGLCAHPRSSGSGSSIIGGSPKRSVRGELAFGAGLGLGEPSLDIPPFLPAPPAVLFSAPRLDPPPKVSSRDGTSSSHLIDCMQGIGFLSIVEYARGKPNIYPSPARSPWTWPTTNN